MNPIGIPIAIAAFHSLAQWTSQWLSERSARQDLDEARKVVDNIDKFVDNIDEQTRQAVAREDPGFLTRVNECRQIHHHKLNALEQRVLRRDVRSSDEWYALIVSIRQFIDDVTGQHEEFETTSSNAGRKKHATWPSTKLANEPTEYSNGVRGTSSASRRRDTAPASVPASRTTTTTTHPITQHTSHVSSTDRAFRPQDNIPGSLTASAMQPARPQPPAWHTRTEHSSSMSSTDSFDGLQDTARSSAAAITRSTSTRRPAAQHSNRMPSADRDGAQSSTSTMYTSSQYSGDIPIPDRNKTPRATVPYPSSVNRAHDATAYATAQHSSDMSSPDRTQRRDTTSSSTSARAAHPALVPATAYIAPPQYSHNISNEDTKNRTRDTVPSPYVPAVRSETAAYATAQYSNNTPTANRAHDGRNTVTSSFRELAISSDIPTDAAVRYSNSKSHTDGAHGLRHGSSSSASIPGSAYVAHETTRYPSSTDRTYSSRDATSHSKSVPATRPAPAPAQHSRNTDSSLRDAASYLAPAARSPPMAPPSAYTTAQYPSTGQNTASYSLHTAVDTRSATSSAPQYYLGADRPRDPASSSASAPQYYSSSSRRDRDNLPERNTAPSSFNGPATTRPASETVGYAPPRHSSSTHRQPESAPSGPYAPSQSAPYVPSAPYTPSAPIPPPGTLYPAAQYLSAPTTGTTSRTTTSTSYSTAYPPGSSGSRPRPR